MRVLVSATSVACAVHCAITPVFAMLAISGAMETVEEVHHQDWWEMPLLVLVAVMAAAGAARQKSVALALVAVFAIFGLFLEDEIIRMAAFTGFAFFQVRSWWICRQTCSAPAET
jgi:hypothetical protein